MANRLQKLLYLLSAETPILLVFALVVVVKESSWVSPYKVSWKLPLVLIICALILNWIFVYSFKFMLEHLQTIPVKGNRITSGDGWLAGYFITYLLPILTFRFGNRIIPLLIIVIVICFIVLTFTDYVTPHPTLYLMKYYFYRIDVDGAASDYLLISKKKVKRVQDVRRVKQVFEYLLIREG